MILDMDLLATCLNASFFLKFAMDWTGNTLLWNEFCYLDTSQDICHILMLFNFFFLK